ncbi:MAG: DUF2310 family Zn-ribbon-containing protein [Peptococcaceae bacterium]|nr:DUF2310 family Zn-ribbon-containing protein [Peptococcaceae bacterium]
MNVFQMAFTRLHPLESKTKHDTLIEHEAINILWDYLACLYKNGQVLRSFKLIKTSENYLAFVTLPENDALDSRHNNAYVAKSLAEVKTLFALSITPIGENLNVIASCTCPETPLWYMLYSDWTDEESPVVCGTCGHSVPLYNLPRILNEEEYYSALMWKQDYQNINRLFMSGVSDRSTYRQMNSLDSQLSKNGLEICRAFESATGIPFYYYVYHYRKYTKTPALCPVCGTDWKLTTKTFVDYKCDTCGLVADEA